MNNLNLELYRFAASRLRSGLEEGLGADLSSLSGVEYSFQEGLADVTTEYLKGNTDGAETSELADRLKEASDRYKERLRTTLKIDSPTREAGLRAQALGFIATNQIGQFPFYAIAINYYAGEKLLEVMETRVKNGSADDNWLRFSRAFSENIQGMLNRYIRFYERDLERREATDQAYFSRTAAAGIHSEITMRVHIEWNQVMQIYYDRFKSLATKLDDALERTKALVESQIPA